MNPANALIARLTTLSLLGAALGPGCGGKAEVVGQVFDATGPVAGVAVKGGKKQVETDADGIFRARVGRGDTLLTLEREGYAPAYRPVTPGGAAWVSTIVEMVPQESFTVDPAAGAASIVAGPFGEVTLAIPEGSVKTRDPYEVRVAYYPIYTGLQTPPVPLMGRSGRALAPLESFGMIEVSLRCGKKACPLEKDATITVRVPTGGSDPSTATLFSADPKTGVWIADGEVSNDGAAWTLPLTHLSWKNIDAFIKVPAAEAACVKLKVVSVTGLPLSGARIIGGWDNNFRRTVRGWTDADGTLCNESFPSTTTVSLQARHFLRPGGRRTVASTLALTPSAVGASCDEARCEEVLLTLACGDDLECGTGYTCVSGACVEDRDPGKVKVTFRNEDSAENIHLWGPDETIDKKNRLTPGSKRRATLELAPGTTPLFNAGRNSTTLASLACLVVTLPHTKAEVIWDGTALRCEGF